MFQAGLFSIPANCSSHWPASLYRRGEALIQSESRWLDRLMPHLSRAAQLQDVRYFATPELFTRVPSLDDWRQPAMLVALNGTVLRLNGATTQMLGRTRLVQVVDGLLELQGAVQRRILDECLAAADVTPAYRMLRLTEEHHGESAGQDALYVFYHPVAVSHGHAALLTFYHPDSPPIVDPDLLASAFDLTPAECRVAFHIAQGRTTKEIASQIGVQHDTVRKQLQAIYQKTATNRQVDLIRLLLNLPAHPAPRLKPGLETRPGVTSPCTRSTGCSGRCRCFDRGRRNCLRTTRGHFPGSCSSRR